MVLGGKNKLLRYIPAYSKLGDDVFLKNYRDHKIHVKIYKYWRVSTITKFISTKVIPCFAILFTWLFAVPQIYCSSGYPTRIKDSGWSVTIKARHSNYGTGKDCADHWEEANLGPSQTAMMELLTSSILDVWVTKLPFWTNISISTISDKIFCRK